MAENETSITITTSSETTTPLLPSRNPNSSPTTRTNTLALLLGRASGRRGGPSTLVRETAALQLEERRADWGYSKPVVALDIAWNLAFLIVSVVMLVSTTNEKPNVPIRVWICGYAFQCLVHVVLVWMEYRRRRVRRVRSIEDGTARVSDSEGIDSEDEDGVGFRSGTRSSVAKRCESLNTMASFIWWIVGFYWIVSGGEILFQNAPRLYWFDLT
ncbi:hypothetical protein GIB67_020875 [Kingdonia uniflora]|uniref:RING-type E3 ubiquitin transferase n=1 Tax=Kingdonia uniflora TaxID=39325 RepID=A0A7J7M7H2_9MAGN|nr:hypothetical protein GIB67_020875 [Kingdonia uniflora]